jgi:hypothetical protein
MRTVLTLREITLVALLAVGSVVAQPVLLPSLGIGAAAGPDTPLCPPPVQTPPLQQNGQVVGGPAADFQLFDMQGNAFHLGTVLMEKPVLMIAGSYTCPRFRDMIPVIDSIQTLYADQLSTVIIYTVEAHPHIDISPYFGVVNTQQTNINQGILYQQPVTHGERLQVANEMLAAMPISVPVLMDGPCNEWWEYYGPAPNIAYLISTDGLIVSRHTWLHQHPQDIFCDIDELLGQPTDCEQFFGGTFTMEWLTNDTIHGPENTTLTVSTRIINNSPLPALVEVHRLENNLPEGWGSALCLDVCYQPQVSYAEVVVPAAGYQDFHFYFYAGAGTAQGHARIGVRNAEMNSNGFMMEFHAFSEGITGMDEIDALPEISVWPIPSTGILHVDGDIRFDAITLHDLHGRIVLAETSGHIKHLDLSTLGSGSYILRAWLNGGPACRPVRVQRL